MSGKPDLRIAGGTDTTRASAGVQLGSTSGHFIQTGLVDESGNRIFRPATGNHSQNGGGGDDGDGVTSIFKLDVKRDVQLAKWGVVALGGALLGMLWFLLSQIDNRFDRADSKVTTITDKVSDLRVEIAGQRGDIKSLLEKLDDKPQGSSGTGESQKVSAGAPKRP